MDSETTLLELKEIVEQFVIERDWKQFHNTKNLSMALSIEASELMDIFKWMTPEECAESMNDEKTKNEALDEIADIMIYSIAFANRNGIDLSKSIMQKMVKNRIKYPVNKYKGHF